MFQRLLGYPNFSGPDRDYLVQQRLQLLVVAHGLGGMLQSLAVLLDGGAHLTGGDGELSLL